MLAHARRLAALCGFFVAFGAGARDARALESFYGLGDEKAGPLMTNLKLGPAIGLSELPTQGSIELEVAYALDEEERAYVGLSIPLGLSSPLVTAGLDASLHYELPIRGVRGLSIVPRASIGFASLSPDTGRGSVAFVFEPAVGAKWNLTELVHVGVEPLAFPLYFGPEFGMQLRPLVYGGLDF